MTMILILMMKILIIIHNSDGRLVDLVSGRRPSPQPSDEEFLAGRQAVDGGHSVQTSQLHGGREGPRQAEDGHYLGGRRPRLKEGEDRGRDCQVQQSGGYWL